MCLKDSLRKVGVAHPGTQHSWETALAFQEVQRLQWYATSSYSKPTYWPEILIQYLPRKLRGWLYGELGRRRDDRLSDRLVLRTFSTEVVERLLRKTVSIRWANALSKRRHEAFSWRISQIVRERPVDVLWGPVECVQAFAIAKETGVTCVLEQPIGHFDALNRTMRVERLKNPEFFLNDQDEIGENDVRAQYRAIELADIVVVGSNFAAQTLVDCGTVKSKIRVVPYGYSPKYFPNVRVTRPKIEGRPIEFLFVGSLGPRKGLAYLLEAFRCIDPREARLTLVGPMGMPADTFRKYEKYVNYVGQLKRPEIAAAMQAADCFVLPSLFEGSALVLYEAVGAGLPIIQSKQAGIGCIDGVNGIILDDVSATAIARAVMRIVREPSQLSKWSDESWKMRDELVWSSYRQRVRDVV